MENKHAGNGDRDVGVMCVVAAFSKVLDQADNSRSKARSQQTVEAYIIMELSIPNKVEHLVSLISPVF